MLKFIKQVFNYFSCNEEKKYRKYKGRCRNVSLKYYYNEPYFIQNMSKKELLDILKHFNWDTLFDISKKLKMSYYNLKNIFHFTEYFNEKYNIDIHKKTKYRYINIWKKFLSCLVSKETVIKAIELRNKHNYSWTKIAEELKLSTSSIYNIFKLKSKYIHKYNLDPKIYDNSK